MKVSTRTEQVFAAGQRLTELAAELRGMAQQHQLGIHCTDALQDAVVDVQRANQELTARLGEMIRQDNK